MKGFPCDENATTAAIAAARREALDRVDLRCSERDTQIIGYLGSFDLQADIIRFCRDWEALATSAAYQPLLPPAPPPDGRARHCAGTVAGAIHKLADLTFRTWQHTLDRLAVRPFDLGSKEAVIAAATQRLSAISHRLAVTLAQHCDESSFATLYGRSTEQFAASLMERASCFAGAFYIQNGTTCPPSHCGNRLVEPGEECDDGNDDDNDACNHLCERPS